MAPTRTWAWALALGLPAVARAGSARAVGCFSADPRNAAGWAESPSAARYFHPHLTEAGTSDHCYLLRGRRAADVEARYATLPGASLRYAFDLPNHAVIDHTALVSRRHRMHHALALLAMHEVPTRTAPEDPTHLRPARRLLASADFTASATHHDHRALMTAVETFGILLATETPVPPDVVDNLINHVLPNPLGNLALMTTLHEQMTRQDVEWLSPEHQRSVAKAVSEYREAVGDLYEGWNAVAAAAAQMPDASGKHFCLAGAAEGANSTYVVFRSPGITASNAFLGMDFDGMDLPEDVRHALPKTDAEKQYLCVGYAFAVLSDVDDCLQVVKYLLPSALSNSDAGQIAQSGDDGLRPIYDAGLLGSNQVIGLGDSGLDQNHCLFRDDDQGSTPATDLFTEYATTFPARRKIVQYVSWHQTMNLYVDDKLEEVLIGGDDIDNTAGHGTHVAGTLAGAEAGTEDVAGAGEADGVAHGSKIAFIDLHRVNNFLNIDGIGDAYNQTIWTPWPTQWVYFPAYVAGARIHSNSWGTFDPDNNAYNFDALLTDSYTHSNDILAVFAAGNQGAIYGSNTINNPAQGKNVVAVGSVSRSDPDTVSAFSSQGCADYATSDFCRIKPDVLAPGENVMSAAPTSGNEDCGSSVLSGTSMAAPVVAGAAALVRDYFESGFYPGGSRASGPALDPTSTLVKAMLVASAVGVTGHRQPDGSIASLGLPPDNIQGHGRVKLDEVLAFDAHSLFVVNSASIALGETQTYTFETPVGASRNFVATLVFSDPAYYPERTPFAQSTNDLNLLVTDESGHMYHPNGRTSPDRANNVEKIYITPATGSPAKTFTVTVNANIIEKPDLSSPDTPSTTYSLVVTGDMGDEATVVAGDEATVVAASAEPSAAPVKVKVGSEAPSVGAAVLCASGVMDAVGSSCCASSCGTCGGCGCSLRGEGSLDGSEYCCPLKIRANGLACILSSDVGCVLPSAPTGPLHDASPTDDVSASPSVASTVHPTAGPTVAASAGPTANPTAAQSAGPTANPTPSLTANPTPADSARPTANPTAGQSAGPPEIPTPKHSAAPTASPTPKLSAGPTTVTSPSSADIPPAATSPSPTQSPVATPSGTDAPTGLTMRPSAAPIVNNPFDDPSC